MFWYSLLRIILEKREKKVSVLDFIQIFMRQVMEKLTFYGLATLFVVEYLKDCIPIWSFGGNFLKL